MEMKLKKSWSPLANTISVLGGSLEWSAQGNLEYLICASHPRQLLSHQIMISCFLELRLNQSVSITLSLIYHIDLFRLRITEYEEIMS